MKIAVLFGGTSEERDVSIASAAQVIPALRALGHDVVAVDTATGRLSAAAERELLSAGVAPEPPEAGAIGALKSRAVAALPGAMDVRDVDVVFLALHGGAGEDGRLQAMLDLAGLRYTGSNHIASAAAMDKDLSKRLFRAALVPTADWLMAPVTAARGRGGARLAGDRQAEQAGLDGRAVGGARGVAARAGAREGRAVRRRGDDRALRGGPRIHGRHPRGPRAAGRRDHRAGRGFDYQSKYQAGGAREVFPADIPADEASQVQEFALRAHRALKLGVYSRVDFRRDDAGGYWCLEVNSLPGMTATSLLPQAARAAGIGFPELLDRICRGAVG